MKVLSIKEPYASLILNGYKHIETRSYKTNYRGEIFIHASKKSINSNLLNPYVIEISKNINMNNGHIILKANLIDCIYMDDKFIDNIKNSNEYKLGMYEIGRYAWILDNIEAIYPIKANGKLNIWNFDGNYQIKKDTNC